jgi:hypothetical protein
MSTEQQQHPQHPHPPHHEHHHKERLETNALGERLVRGWGQFKQGQLISYRAMAVILLVVAAVGVGIYIWAEKAKTRSLAWLDLEGVNSDTGLKEFADAHPGTTVARVAELHRARHLLGPEGIDKLPTARDEAERKKAIENVVAARDQMEKLAGELKDDSVMRVECYLGLAKAEGALVGVPKDDSPTEHRGSIDKMVEWLNKVIEAAPGTPWADEATKTVESLKTPATREKFKQLQEQLYAKSNFDLAPGTAPKSPLDGLGGLPGLSPGGSGLPNIPGFPSGTGLPNPKPPEPPSVAPTTPGPTSPGPKPPEPSAPTPPAKSPPSTATTPTSPAPAPKPPEPPAKTPEPKKEAAPQPPAPKPPEPPKK